MKPRCPKCGRTKFGRPEELVTLISSRSQTYSRVSGWRIWCAMCGWSERVRVNDVTRLAIGEEGKP